jgi:DNA (cytosine-5)-methyltransferase 1
VVAGDARDLTGADLLPPDAPATWRPSLLVGGPPCQPWSSAGHQRGLDDPRGQLFVDMIRLTADLSPRFVLMENVRGLVTAIGPHGRSGEVLKSLQAELSDLGYASRIATLNAADYGAAQRRVRLLLLASREYDLPEFPHPTHARDGDTNLKPWVSLSELLDTLPYPDTADVVRPTGTRANELSQLSPGQGLRTGGKTESNRPGGHWGYRQDCFVADMSLPSRTIRAASTPDWIQEHDGQLRRLTWRECAALQGFPTNWRFHGTRASRFRQIGNAMQVDVAHLVGESLRAALEKFPAQRAPITPPWPDELQRRVRYTAMEHRINGKHRVRVRATND